MKAVYSVAWSKDGPSKVGVAAKVIDRIFEIQTGNPYRLRIYFAALMQDDRAFDVESAVLRDLNDRRMIGEWLSLAPLELAEHIRSAADSMKVSWLLWKPSEVQWERRLAQLEGKESQLEKRLSDAYAEARQLWG